MAMLTVLTGAFGAVGKLRYLITLGPFSITIYLDRLVFNYNLVPPNVHGRCHSNAFKHPAT